MGDYRKTLLLVALTLAVISAGCTLPGTSPKGGDAGVLMPVSPTPTATPSPSPTPTPSPTPAPTVAAQYTVAAPSSGDFVHTYVWDYKDVEWRFTAVVQGAKYDLFRAMPHSAGMSFASYALSGEDRDLIRSAVAQIKQGGAGYGYTRYDDAVNLITFVQSIPYADDHQAGAPRYPLETLALVKGDCKDKSVLAAALLKEAGFDVALLDFKGTPGHVALGIAVDAGGASFSKDGTRYYYVEMTSPGWAIGEMPDELKSIQPTVTPVMKNPGLSVTVRADAVDAFSNVVYYKAYYTVTNQGPGTARQVSVKVRAMAPKEGDNVIYDREIAVDLGDLAEGQTMSGDALLMLPAGVPTRFIGLADGENADPATASTPEFVTGT